MFVIAGSISVDPADRDAYLRGCAPIVQRARTEPGCLDFALSPDPLDPARINVYERWESEADLERFRGSGPSEDQEGEIVSASVARYVVASVQAP
ncbi:antibiotic biosynthesis monooxygenase [Nocardiopsis sp. CNR-923]|uniref:putative quinol monooxygenase n=1 Tax=Nocardiopsis sp. CNR-923 TaxID=1904965 RepID=UPI000965FED1|nr:antibiotic biosynthesis monooxygenase family protein [Nocardiopsis sp. CNR-923]OLT27806.1 antibiotic biosynthesis monooxygenase [Nocardiopsis sp. CNR-923]